MASKKSTKRALLTSVLCLVLCMSMLIGTTFAWFTDTVTSGVNQIVAGNLDVEVYYDDDGEQTSIQNVDTLFNNADGDPILWEPGVVAYENLTVVNEGNLALKYALSINFDNENTVDGYGLSDVLQIAVVKDGIDKNLSREQLVASITDWQPLSAWAVNDYLPEQGDAHTYGVVIWWEPSADDNNWNVNNGKTTTDGEPLHIDLGVKLVATQKDAEPDSFGNDYDEFASVIVTTEAEEGKYTSLAEAIQAVEEGGIVFVEPGKYDLSSVIVIEGKSLSIVGLGDVTIVKQFGNSHMFTLKNGADVTFENLTLDGNNKDRNGIYVRWNSKATLKDVVIKNTNSCDILVDEASDVINGDITESTASYVWLYNSHVEDVALCAAPTKEGHIDTYVYFNYDADSTIGSIEKQSVNLKPENIYINGVNVESNGMNLYVSNDAELAAALETIQNNSKYHNVQVYVHLAAGTYSGDYVINQYPEWNGIVGAGNTANNYASGVPAGAPSTVITFVGETTIARAADPAVVFTGNVTVNGFGNAGTGFKTAVAHTTFQNVTFDAANSIEANNEDYIVMYVKAAASNVTFDGCTFVNATHVTLGNSGADGVGQVDVTGCTFKDGGALSGYVETLNVSNTTVTAAKNGFIDKKKAGDVTVEDCVVKAGKYFLRTSNSGINATVENTTITLYESEGTNYLVYFRGSNESAEFIDCTIADGWTTAGVDTDSALTIANYYTVDGVVYYKDGITSERVLYLVPADYEGTTLNVAEGTTQIGDYAFIYNSNVETVVLSSTVRDLGRGFDSSTVKKVVLNEGLEVISSRAFRSTTALEEVVISSTVTEIADNAFQKTGIKEIVIPANVKTIGETAFGSSMIEKVTFEGDIAIQGYAFRGCTKLHTVIMKGYNVTFIASTLNGRDSMWFCNSESNNPNTSDIDFYVKNEVIKERVLTAMGAERNNTDVYCEQTAVTDNEGNALYYTDTPGTAYTYDSTGLVAALEADKDVVLCVDTKIDPANMSNAYGKTGINVKNGQTIDGNGNTLDIKGAGGTWDSGINTTGGTIKNITITGSFRGIFINHNSDHSEKVILENVTIDGTTYTISCDQGTNNNFEATNCTFNGWTSYAATLGSAKFTNCSFGEGNGYAYCRPYAPTTFVGCDFEAGFEMDARATVTFENCTIGGVALTAENLSTLVTSNIANATVK